MLNEPVQAKADPREIIIVEDDPLLRNLVVEIVAEMGAPCRSFSNCDDALIYRLQAGPCLALIVDNLVPGSIHGAEFISMHYDRWPDVPAILMSGTDFSGECLPPNAVFLMKPWSAEDLLLFLHGAVAGESTFPARSPPSPRGTTIG